MGTWMIGVPVPPSLKKLQLLGAGRAMRLTINEDEYGRQKRE
ncbi:MAG: hypothetical protein ACP5U1_03785 [Desulfomonilaceae bacterium]